MSTTALENIIDAEPILTEADARALTDEIRTNLERDWELIVRAYTERAWKALGYASWDGYCTTEFGGVRPRLPREVQQAFVRFLREAGLSMRAIAAATGVSKSTIQRNLSPVPTGTPGAPTANTPGQPDHVADALARAGGKTGLAPVIGLDGKRSSPSKTKPEPLERIPASEKYAHIEAPPDVIQVDTWVYDNDNTDWAKRYVLAKIWRWGLTDICVEGYQSHGGTVKWQACIDDDVCMSAEFREYAAMLLEAADQLDSLLAVQCPVRGSR